MLYGVYEKGQNGSVRRIYPYRGLSIKSLEAAYRIVKNFGSTSSVYTIFGYENEDDYQEIEKLSYEDAAWKLDVAKYSNIKNKC